ncbi:MULTISPECIES: DNA cytosine methyltransferase [unclassified Herbaspirillum]|uniref:DNA cytosine methyltransferase n=1 Tax=unclassified Herbaspirillum TaxID=2624150 RepID=UPI000E2F1D31|nr:MULTISPECIES: DNA cytosine methyltransferase [unclassified Herbaspirillum]RFB67379.1 DNA cytosine methyltransferase [Herbaspirillum sp. 3R-3a1]TFI04988.1 DNA cytosine methyltransferase [Herbaspirillum sp. 3R11]TFI12681.1 DNA cytosine methyltransferase [Herbaspirillum sp. 3R-11]TFI27956.1 DNA cytosine methyltransferase [Herbaspirillum sp. 3C11]
MPIPVVDIFAGPGGLGEGFSAFKPSRSSDSPFRIGISAEMEMNAAKTLRLRAFFRQFQQGHAPKSYYDYVEGTRAAPWTEKTRAEWDKAGEEARQLTLGNEEHDQILHARIKKLTKSDQPWVLIGGPPCQAYSLVGRSRNVGKAGYKAEEDHRHYLYLHYLKILHEFRPAVFVMENVKGILSSKVSGELMFPKILDDLTQAGGKSGEKYRIIPLAVPQDDPKTKGSGREFVLRAENLGVPQARHRVILLGVREDIDITKGSFLHPQKDKYSVSDVIAGLPALRSGVTDEDFEHWSEFARSVLRSAGDATDDEMVRNALHRHANSLRAADPGQGGRWMPKIATSDNVPEHLRAWLIDPRLNGILNHEVRQHMRSDLTRYGFAAAYAKHHGHSPRGSKEFPKELYPDHKNWKSGKFVDRFKVQISALPSSTVTSHLSKDGHYFIHPDAKQLRSLSVREAARLQTFPDNYFFEGSRNAQFKQVGNAVSPWMAQQIAQVVYSLLSPKNSR